MNYVNYHYNRQIPVRDGSVRSSLDLWLVISLLVIATSLFGWLAVRNARTLSCDDITWDQYHQVRVCEMQLNNDGSIKQ